MLGSRALSIEVMKLYDKNLKTKSIFFQYECSICFCLSVCVKVFNFFYSFVLFAIFMVFIYGLFDHSIIQVDCDHSQSAFQDCLLKYDLSFPCYDTHINHEQQLIVLNFICFSSLPPSSPQAGVDGMKASSQSHMMKWFLRAMPVIMWPVMSNFPTVSVCNECLVCGLIGV